MAKDMIYFVVDDFDSAVLDALQVLVLVLVIRNKHKDSLDNHNDDDHNDNVVDNVDDGSDGDAQDALVGDAGQARGLPGRRLRGDARGNLRLQVPRTRTCSLFNF